jgi:hypothetical protein
MKAVPLLAAVLIALAGAMYLSSQIPGGIVRPVASPRLDSISSIGLTGPEYGFPPVPTTGRQQPAAGSEPEQPVGTAGRQEPGSADSELRSVPVGGRVTLHVHAEDVNNDPAFSVGSGDDQMLVVMHRDTRTSAERQEGVASRHGIAPVDGGGHLITIEGIIQTMPRAEEMASWNLTRDEKLLLAERGAYIRADRVTPEGYTESVAP